MKNTLFALLALVVAGQASATSLRRDVRLSFRQIPTGSRPSFNVKTTRINVYNDGTVEKIVSQKEPLVPSVVTVVARLSADRMDEIENQINDARYGVTVPTTFHAMCFVAPVTTGEWMADNGEVFLQTGDICTGFKYNNTDAAKKLVGTLNELRNAPQGN